ncbi:MAG: tRNA preQ1(34) S-adenosylmethionine ribosyltransferase-isomerase QueA [Rickettsiaceae bacterium]|nr:tRNA preQ1(34) S-adenosylmethionine ribosyltransferase-isomerase QueA [Rickettsiaceae bacterium]
MKLQDFDFDLPEQLIAQIPSDKRDHAKLLIASEEVHNSRIVNFYEIIDFFKAGDLVVFNNSKVINAKLTLTSAQGASININLNKPIDINEWSCFAKPAKKLKIGDIFHIDKHQLIISDKKEYGEINIKFHLHNQNIFDFLEKYGEVPLPQYIKRYGKSASLDKDRYQTVYSNEQGSVAAPTAGLHFTSDLLERIRNKGVEIAFVTLHVGGGTFLPVRSDNLQDHIMHEEWCEISQEAANMINRAKQETRRIIAVGTTTIRTLESHAENNIIKPGAIKTDIFIKPGYQFQIADALVTNFHLPKSTLFMLVCAFIGTDKAKALYKYAISHNLRFFSYGDAMILNRLD